MFRDLTVQLEALACLCGPEPPALFPLFLSFLFFLFFLVLSLFPSLSYSLSLSPSFFWMEKSAEVGYLLNLARYFRVREREREARRKHTHTHTLIHSEKGAKKCIEERRGSGKGFSIATDLPAVRRKRRRKGRKKKKKKKKKKWLNISERKCFYYSWPLLFHPSIPSSGRAFWRR